jgi:outer membrane biosynthesis protein TonB
MDKNQIRKEIAALITSIKEHSDNIGEKEHIPQLELELILHKIEKLYQKSIVYNHLSSMAEMAAAATVTPAVAEPKPELPEKEEPKKEDIKKEEQKPEPKQETVTRVDLFGTEVAPVAEKPKQEKKPEKKEEKKEEKPATNIQKPAISDIRAAIGINDKFQFANELFGGNMQEYEIAIQQLNTAGTLDSATEYFMSIQQLYNWNNEHETVKRLFDLVERRYS